MPGGGGHRAFALPAALLLLCLLAEAPGPAFGKRNKDRSCAMSSVKAVEATCHENAACANSYARSLQAAVADDGAASPAHRKPKPSRGGPCKPYQCGACITSCLASISLGGDCTKESCRDSCLADPQYNCTKASNSSSSSSGSLSTNGATATTCIDRMVARVNEVSKECGECALGNNNTGAKGRRRLAQSNSDRVGACTNACVADLLRRKPGFDRNDAWIGCSINCAPNPDYGFGK